MEEVWKDIIWDKSSYQVSNKGNIRNLNNCSKIIKQHKNRYGYLTVILCCNYKRKSENVHRLIAKAFLSNPENKTNVNHKNGIKSDNRLENLEWITPSENTIHAYKTGLRFPLKGINNPNSKLTFEKVQEIREKYKTGKYFQREIAEEYGLSQVQVGNIVRNEQWILSK